MRRRVPYMSQRAVVEFTQSLSRADATLSVVSRDGFDVVIEELAIVAQLSFLDLSLANHPVMLDPSSDELRSLVDPSARFRPSRYHNARTGLAVSISWTGITDRRKVQHSWLPFPGRCTTYSATNPTRGETGRTRRSGRRAAGTGRFWSSPSGASSNTATTSRSGPTRFS